MDAFYKLKPTSFQPANLGGKGYNEDVMGAGAKAFAYYIMDRWTLDEALEYWEEEGNLILREKPS